MALKDDGVNIINGINYGAFTEALNNKMDRNLANLDNDGQAILDEKMDINFTNISAETPAYFDIRCIYKDQTTGLDTEVSCLYNVLSISNPEYFYDSTLFT